MTDRQTLILSRVRDIRCIYSTTHAARGTGLTTAQVYKVLRQLASKGLVRSASGYWKTVPAMEAQP